MARSGERHWNSSGLSVTYCVSVDADLTQVETETYWEISGRGNGRVSSAIRVDRKGEFLYDFVLVYDLNMSIGALQFHSICMDNASNCDTTATELKILIPGFRGALSRSRCFAHIINLVAKVC